MIVQGVAGSGKSVVGLHRIAYLLSPFNERPEQFTTSGVIFFGPTKTFLRYVGGLLPSLDVRDVNQTTVHDWLSSMLSGRIYMDQGEPLLEKLLKQASDKSQDAYQAAKLKGSLQMARTLERHVNGLKKQFLADATGIAVHVDSPTPFIVAAANVRKIVQRLRPGPLNVQRGRLISDLVDELWQLYGDRVRGLARPLMNRREFVERVRPQVAKQVTEFWPELDFRREYRQVLSDPNALAVASSKKIGRQDSAKLATSLPKGPNVFKPEDIGALCFLDHLLNEHPNARFEHVVLDEAQEISPIELRIIRQHSQGNGFTILGDLTQSLSPQGIDQWRDVLELFRGATVSRYRVRTSYRATSEITRYANRILKEAGPGRGAALPLQHHGPPPVFRGARNYEAMVTAVADDISDLKSQGMETIGVLCKSASDAKKLHRALRNSGMNDLGLLDRENVTSESVVVAPIDLTRGLEYDAVIVTGVSKEHFPATPLHTRLLYVAVTRAAHQLQLHWFGQPAPQLGFKPPRTSEPSRRKSRTRNAGSTATRRASEVSDAHLARA